MSDCLVRYFIDWRFFIVAVIVGTIALIVQRINEK